MSCKIIIFFRLLEPLKYYETVQLPILYFDDKFPLYNRTKELSLAI